MLVPDSFRIANRKLYPARVSVLVSVRFVIPCSWLHFDALLQTAKPVRLQENASCCAQVRTRSMRRATYFTRIRTQRLRDVPAPAK